MDTILVEFSESALLKALEINLHAHIPLFSIMPRSTLWKEPGFLALLTDLDISENYVYLAQFTPENAGQKIVQVLERYRSQGCLPMLWQVGPFTLPPDLGKYLLTSGFSFLVRAPGMAADLQQLKAPSISGDFVIEPVRTSEQLRQWVNIVGKVDEISTALREGFYQVFSTLGFDESNDSQLFQGLENGQPVATSRLLCVGGVAGIWHVVTLPEARGKGYGTAMTLAVAQAGHERGYRFGILYATMAGYSLYRRLGFQEYCHIDVYKSPDTEGVTKNERSN